MACSSAGILAILFLFSLDLDGICILFLFCMDLDEFGQIVVGLAKFFLFCMDLDRLSCYSS
jgi:hypothetical protein